MAINIQAAACTAGTCSCGAANNKTNMETNMKTVLITGCSSGYGLATARHFHAQGWNVVATMRTPRADVLPRSDRLRVLALDVTKPESIAATLEACGPIDVLVNNAGIGVIGAFEATPMSTVREVFETNTFGVMAMTQAMLPQFRARRSGVVVNVTSSVTLARMPLADFLRVPTRWRCFSRDDDVRVGRQRPSIGIRTTMKPNEAAYYGDKYVYSCASLCASAAGQTRASGKLSMIGSLIPVPCSACWAARVCHVCVSINSLT